MIKAVIFDMDGVISDTETTRFIFLKKFLKKKGIDVSDDYCKKFIGKKTRILLREYFSKQLSEQEIEDIYNKRKEEFHRHPEKYILPQPHIIECCKDLFNAGYKMAIASTSDMKSIELILNTLNIRKYFMILIGFEKIKNMKPDPEVYLKCVEELGLKKEECLAIEDSPVGVKSAKSAGLVCIGVTYTLKKDELLEADIIIDSLDKLNDEFIKKKIK